MSNCKNCGAVLPVNNSVCEYCETRNFVDFKSSVSRETFGLSQRKCALCSTQMETINVGSETKHLPIEKCNHCHSLFFDNGEIELMLEMHSGDPTSINRQRLHELCELAMESAERKAYIPCPVCSQLMNRQLFGVKSSVVVDICHDHGLFFEPGEIRHLIEWKRAGGQILDKNTKANAPKERPRKTSSSHEFESYGDGGFSSSRNGGFLGMALEMFFDILD
jgi:Zn-finger nucleic acid-binding protein